VPDTDAGPGFEVPNLVHWILLGIAIALTIVAPVRLLPPSELPVLPGGLLAATGTTLWVWGHRTMSRQHTSADPASAPTALVDDGPYRFSRNPTYLGLAVVFLGATVAFNSVWLLGFTAAEFLLADRQVRREESYLALRFGEAYLDYQSRVRRWL
jgi:protein-S-isoprenylcysteine O-methyltransferase Ste14